MLNQKSEILEMLKKSEDKKITILLHTYNRPEFLKRVLKHIFNNANWNILDLIILVSLKSSINSFTFLPFKGHKSYNNLSNY